MFAKSRVCAHFKILSELLVDIGDTLQRARMKIEAEDRRLAKASTASRKVEAVLRRVDAELQFHQKSNVLVGGLVVSACAWFEQALNEYLQLLRARKGGLPGQTSLPAGRIDDLKQVFRKDSGIEKPFEMAEWNRFKLYHKARSVLAHSGGSLADLKGTDSRKLAALAKLNSGLAVLEAGHIRMGCAFVNAVVRDLTRLLEAFEADVMAVLLAQRRAGA